MKNMGEVLIAVFHNVRQIRVIVSKNMGEVRREVVNQVWDQVSGQIRIQVRLQVGGRVWNSFKKTQENP